MSDDEKVMTGSVMSIGAISRATGVPVETLRTWERRYGFPNPRRNPSGHRVYDPQTVDRIRLVDRALQLGNRAANVVPLSEGEIHDLIAAQPVLEGVTSSAGLLEPWLQAARDFDGLRFEQQLQEALLQLGTTRFVAERAGPFLVELGQAWAEKRLAVAHEHFASERLRDFLTTRWRTLSDQSKGPIIVCATLPGENHVLGLHMCALICATAGLRVLNIGSDAPVDQIAATANSKRSVGVAISISLAADRYAARYELAQIREALDDTVELIVGGEGAPRGLTGVTTLGAFDELEHWAKQAS